MARHETQASEEGMYGGVFLLLQQVIKRSFEFRSKDDVSHALLCFLVRVANTWCSIRTLRQHSRNENLFGVDAEVLLRAMLDACFQAEYLVHDEQSMYERAKEYLDYKHVERFNTKKRMQDHNTQLANDVKSLAKRPEGEKRLSEEYDRVKDKYLVKRRNRGGTGTRNVKTRDTWYSGNLSSLAEKLGKRAEYDTFVATFNASVHSSALAVDEGPILQPEHALTFASKIAARVARLNARHNQIELEDSYKLLMDALCTSLLEPVSGEGPGA